MCSLQVKLQANLTYIRCTVLHKRNYGSLIVSTQSAPDFNLSILKLKLDVLNNIFSQKGPRRESKGNECG